jgi:hypothetical protein
MSHALQHDSDHCDHHRTVEVVFPRNRLCPPVIDSPTWRTSCRSRARVVRLAPKCKYAVAKGACVKLLRGETNEVPTPLAACKAVRSVLCPSYLEEVIAGAEGALILLSWQEEASESSDNSSEESVVFSPSFSPPSDDGARIEESLPIRVQEGDVYCCTIRFQRTTGAAASAIKTYVDQLFGEIGVTLEGCVSIEWQTQAKEDCGGVQILRVDASYEYGPFYMVDGHGHLVHAASGGLMYVPHRYLLEGPALWATVRFPLSTSEVAGPHRHCYT